MKYTVQPVTVDGCECEDCHAGRHLYNLFRCPEEFFVHQCRLPLDLCQDGKKL